ncbi:hypothetical protein LBMAG03_12300 [Actinomycetes bacterium]|nr:hypothetical protein LBMAG03_12300 [Actinomycetes bacterium]
MHLAIHMYECEEIAAESTQMWCNNGHSCARGNRGVGCVSAECKNMCTRLGCGTIGAGHHAEA